MVNLQEFHADRNRLEGEVGDAFSNSVSLERINLAHNNLNGSFPVLRDLKNLTLIILRDNNFDRVKSNSFAGDDSLMLLDLSRQRSFLIFESYAFASVPRTTEFVFTGNSVTTISSNAFQGLKGISLDLHDLSIHTLAPNAFNGNVIFISLSLSLSLFSSSQHSNTHTHTIQALEILLNLI